MKSLSCVRLFAIPWTVAYQAPQSMEFSRQEYWSGLPFPSPNLPSILKSRDITLLTKEHIESVVMCFPCIVLGMFTIVESRKNKYFPNSVRLYHFCYKVKNLKEALEHFISKFNKCSLTYHNFEHNCENHKKLIFTFWSLITKYLACLDGFIS